MFVAACAGGARAQEEAPQLLAQNGADCYAIGQRIAAENGGTLAKATAQSQGGSTVCKIVVLVPGGSGERPRRAEFTVPAG
ncbi:hypothetical protein [Nitratireductor luteus]|uniref:hypothetical protein n=1 Tax=Nitratireductor luteus TaxID=2976980 RepID=UPI00223F79DD|nr:hypothetical protein [Nitratireductor luteus]